MGIKKIKKGTVLDFVVQGIVGELKLVIEVIEVTPHRKLLVKSNGSLKGFGLDTLEKNGAQTLVRIRWEVASTGWLMNLAGLVIRPLLKTPPRQGDGRRLPRASKAPGRLGSDDGSQRQHHCGAGFAFEVGFGVFGGK